MASDELVALLVQVIQRPGEVDPRRKAAELFEQRGAGAGDEAMAMLSTLVNFTGHEERTRLPCLCKTCLAKSGATAEVEGVQFRRSFAVHGTRVLWFWLVEELAEQRAEVKRAVAGALRGRLASTGGGGGDDDDDGDDDDGDDDGDDEESDD
jgi:hypothetical protein